MPDHDGKRLSKTLMHYTYQDLSNYTHCRTLTAMDHHLVEGVGEAPSLSSPRLALLTERREQHKQQYKEHLQQSGLLVRKIGGKGIDSASMEKTLAMMVAGVDVITGGVIVDSEWAGRTDFLVRVEGTSNFGDWHYEPLLTTLAREPTAGAALQLCLHTELLASVQGVVPVNFHVVPPWKDFARDSFRYQDYAAYFRQIKRCFGNYLKNPGEIPYPDPKSHCETCHWHTVCNRRRRDDDHLSFVANLTRSQISELHDQGVTTLAQLAGLPLPLEFTPKHGSKQLLEKAREQARVQQQSRQSGHAIVERLPVEEDTGLCLLPEPDDADMFLVFERDALAGPHGLEYLLGYLARSSTGKWEHHAHWAFNQGDERKAFEKLVDFVMERWTQKPGLHLYHYASGEPSVLKRLMGRFGTREDEIDQMLRANLFIDLHSVVRNSLRAGVESYSLQHLGPLIDNERSTSPDKSAAARASLKSDLSLDRPEMIAPAIKNDIRAFNEDECRTTLKLRDWLETKRREGIAAGEIINRPKAVEADASESISQRMHEVTELVELLTEDMPENPDDRSAEQSARWLLSNILDFYRREDKSVWWNYFRLAGLSAADLMTDREALSGLVYTDIVDIQGRSEVHRYNFPRQECEIRIGDTLQQQGGEPFGTVVDLFLRMGLVDIKKPFKRFGVHPAAVFKHNHVNKKVLEDALIRLGDHVAEHGFESEGPYQAACDLLLRLPPRGVPQPLKREAETTLDAAIRIVCSMHSGILPIQGPPGAGKTFAGSRMVCALVSQGKKVGVTANSHKVIRNMLDGICKAAHEQGMALTCMHKAGQVEKDQAQLKFASQNQELIDKLKNGTNVGGATAWFWSRQQAESIVDILIVDEAAQMSLANVLAISGAARVLVLLGDPRQLDQPVQGTHPDGTAVSALEHLLGDEETIPARKGLFLDQTWRLHPDICSLTSDLFYAGKLASHDHNVRQHIVSESAVSGAGHWYLPVEHTGNVNSSVEEAEAIKRIVKDMLDKSSSWTNRLNRSAPLCPDDILVITPYNAQMEEIQKRLPKIRVGTVDKFQGQEAPIAIYSTATSTPADAPRGLEFLYNPNRLNVATSRAKCACILVSSPSLMLADCRTPRQMQLVNAFCHYAERSKILKYR